MKRTLPTSLIVAICGAFFFLTGCGKSDAPASTPEQVQSSVDPLRSVPASSCSTSRCLEEEERARLVREHEQKVAAVVDAGPKAEPNTPDSAYKELKTDFDTGVVRQAFGAHMSPEDIGSHFRNVSGEADAFKKEEKQKAAVAQIDAAVQALAGDRYVVLKVGVTLQPFDMATRSFKVNGFNHGHIQLGIGDTLFGTMFLLSNGDAVATWKVTDDAVARKVEAMRANGQSFIADIYTFIVGAIPGRDDQIDTVVTKVILRDPNGSELATLKP